MIRKGGLQRFSLRRDNAALGDQAGDQTRRRHVETEVCRSRPFGNDSDCGNAAIRGTSAGRENLVGGALLILGVVLAARGFAAARTRTAAAASRA